MEVLSSLLDNLDEGLLILDTEGKILFFNRVAIAFGRTLAITPFQQGDFLLESLGLETSELLREALQEIKRIEAPEKTFAEVRNQNGVTVSFEFNLVPVINEDGLITHLHLFIRDITAQKIFENRIATLAANTTHLIENANAIIMGVDARGYITDWNKHCSVVTGFTKDEAYAQKLVNLILNENEKPILEELITHVLNHEPLQNFEILIHTKEGKPRNLLLNITVRTTSKREVVGLLLVGQDITELTEYRKSLESKVEERTKELQRALAKEKEIVEMKSRFVSIASHEFRTPLAAIQFELDALKNKGMKRETLMKRLGRVETQIHHMNLLLDDVLTYGKNETGKIQLIFSTISLVEFLNRTIQEVTQGKLKTHTIEADYYNLPELIRTDEKLLRGILINLLTNAIKFSPTRAHVFLTVKGEGMNIKIRVRDEGLGIAEEEVDKIFEPYLRGKSAEGIQGTGLGLSIVKKSVELLGGTIRVESEMGNGATFTVTVPVQQADQ